MKLNDLAQRVLILSHLSNTVDTIETDLEAAIWSVCPYQTDEDFRKDIFQADGWKAVALSHSFLAE